MMKSLAIVFPGQGSQSVGMLNEISQEYPQILETFHEASSVLGYDLWQLVQTGPTEELDKTMRTQPALLAASYAIWKILVIQKHVQPAFLAGHSLGEYTALTCAGSLTFIDAIRLVAARGEYMQEAVASGQSGLAAIIGLSDQDVQSLCEKAVLPNETLSPANFNSPGQVVIAGHLSAVQRALILAKEAGARMAKLLPVSVASHCSLMQPAAERLAILLESIEIKVPTIPIVSNVDVKIYQNPNEIRDGLVRQLYMPVRWVEIIQFFSQKGITHVVECGPGKVLTGLNKRIITDLQLTSTADVTSLRELDFQI